MIISIIYGQFVADKLPLAISARRGGIWKPEYRLHSLWLPSLIINPIGLGIFGAALRYRLNWGVLAFGTFLISVGSLSLVPVTVNYLCECFTQYPAEASIILNVYRLVFGLTIPFFVNPWIAAVGVGWVWGMAAIFSALSFGLVVLLIWKGHTVRSWTSPRLLTTEEGMSVVEEHHGGRNS